MRYCSGEIVVVGVRWNGDCNVGETGFVGSDGGCGDGIVCTVVVDVVTIGALAKCASDFGLGFEAARVSSDGYCSELVGGEMGAAIWRATLSTAN